tara:strand:+ start:408 stop:617 length:210 start_codon:yes stop_codon:yes gene_type:complete
MRKEISNRGIPNQSGLEIYVEVTVFAPTDPQAEDGNVKILVPLTATDKYGNLHQIYRRDSGNVINVDEV